MHMYNRLDHTVNINECKQLEKTAYLFKEPATGMSFVLKVSQKDELGDIALDVLEQEFRKLVYLSNEPEIANVNYLVSVTLHDMTKTIGYLMEYIKGKSLKSYLQENTFIDFDILLNFTREILFALEKAHHHGIAHQDLHTGNIMVNDLGYIKLIDFLDMTALLNEKDNYHDDIRQIKEIAEEFYKKIEPLEDKRRYIAIKAFLFDLDNLKGATKKFDEIVYVLDELMHFDTYFFRIFYILCNNIDIDKLDRTLQYTTPIHSIQIDSLGIDTKNTTVLLKEMVQTKLKRMYLTKFSSLISINLFMEPLIYIKEINADIVSYDVMFILTPKFIKYKKIIDNYDLFEIYSSSSDKIRDIHDIALIDIKTFLEEPSRQIEVLTNNFTELSIQLEKNKEDAIKSEGIIYDNFLQKIEILSKNIALDEIKNQGYNY